MVITSTTQWTIPLSSSSLSASSPPASTRQSSVLGLKSCQLSAPQHAVNSSLEPRRHSHHQDLHSTSSRRLQGAENVISRRSAGSFRQLVPDAFFAKVGREGLRSRETSHSKQFECKYDGIAMPSPLRAPDVGKAAGAAVCGNLIDVHGEITADDVDLLPMPGLSTCPSPFAIDSVYVSGSQSPKHSRNVELASPESSGSSSKSGFSVPNYLGLPPEFDTGLAAGYKAPECAAGLVDGSSHTGASRVEPAKCGESNSSQIGRVQCRRDADNFPDSLAGLWAIPVGADCMLHDSGSLASIFNVYPQNFHGFPSMEQSFDMGNTESAQCIMDGFQCLVNLSKENCEEKGKIRDLPQGLSSELHAFGVKGLGSSIMLGADSAHGNPCAMLSNPNVSELKGSVQVSATDVSAVSYASSLSHSRSYAGPLSPLKNVGEAISLKRPFSALDLISMASSDISTGSCITGSKPWFSAKPVATKGNDELKSCGPFLYDFPVDCTLPGNLHHHFTAKSGGSVNENILPKPPPAKIRRKHGTAMDPQSIAARTRREKFSDRIRVLQSLVPNGERLDTVSMLSQTLEYVKFLQHQVWHLYHGKDPASVTDTCEKWRDFVEAAPASAN